MGDPRTSQGKEGKVLVDGFVHLMLSQVSTRVLTFILNWLVVKRISPDDYGLAAQFQLLTGSILFISREGFRRGCLRVDGVSQDSSRSTSVAKMMTVAWLTVPAGVFLAVGCCLVVVQWQHLNASDPRAQAIYLLGLAAVLELCSEPLYILAQALLLIRLRVAAEGAATLIRCVVTYWLVLQGTATRGGLVFAFAEIAYSSTLLLAYWGYFLHKQWRSRHLAAGAQKDENAHLALFPGRLGGPMGLDRPLLRLCGVFSSQALVKHFLGKGGEMVLALTDSRYNQGVYNLVVNLGSLVVRTVLQPFEESAFLMFTRASQTKGRAGAGARGEWAHLLSLSIKLTSLLGLLFVSFGPPFAYTMLALIYGAKWSSGEAPATLACYCFLILALALNGTTEAFLHAVGDEAQLGRSNAVLVAFSVCHLALNVALIRAAGAAGLILSDCCNMAMRIAYSVSFINGNFKEDPSFSFFRALPKAPVGLSFALAAVACHVSEAAFLTKDNGGLPLVPAAAHVAVGCCCLAGVAASVFVFERQFLRDVMALTRGGRGPAEKKED